MHEFECYHKALKLLLSQDLVVITLDCICNSLG